MTIILSLEAVLLFLAAALAVVGAGWFVPEVVLGESLRLAPLTVRIILGILALVFLVAAGVCAALARERRGLGRALRQSGPKGMVFISPEAVRQLAVGILAQELSAHPFRVRLHPKTNGLILKVFLRLPPGERVPELTERIQSLLSQEVTSRTGLDVQEVQIVIHGAAPLEK